MTAPVLALFGVTDQEIQQFALKYAAAWSQVPARLERVLAIAQNPATTGTAKQPVISATQDLQSQYAAVSADVGTLLTQVETGQSVDLGLAAQTIPRALGVLQGTDQVERAVGLTPGVPVSITANIPWWAYLAVGGIIVWFLTRRRRR